jgi:hypothetical protein
MCKCDLSPGSFLRTGQRRRNEHQTDEGPYAEIGLPLPSRVLTNGFDTIFIHRGERILDLNLPYVGL